MLRMFSSRTRRAEEPPVRQEEAQEPSPAPFEEEPAQPSEPREEGKAQPKVKPLEVPPREGSIEKYDSVASEMPMTPADTTDASSARRVARKDHPGPSPLRPAPSPATDGDRSPLPSAGNHGPPLPSVADQAPSPLPSEAASNASPDGRAVVRSPDSAALAERNGTIAAEMLQDLLRACDALSEALLLRLVGTPSPSPASQLLAKALMVALSEKPVLVRNAETGERAASFWAAAKDAITDAPDIFLDRVRALPRAELPATVVRRLGTILSDPKCNARAEAKGEGDVATLAWFLTRLHAYHQNLLDPTDVVDVGLERSPSINTKPFPGRSPTGRGSPSMSRLASAGSIRLDWSVLDDIDEPQRSEVRAGMEALQSIRREDIDRVRALRAPSDKITQLLEAIAAVVVPESQAGKDGPGKDKAATGSPVRRLLQSHSATVAALSSAFSHPLPGRVVIELRRLVGPLSNDVVAAAGGVECSKLLTVLRGVWRLNDSGPAPSARDGKALRGQQDAPPSPAPRAAPRSPAAPATPDSPADELLQAIREFRTGRNQPPQAHLLAEAICEGLGVAPVREQDVATGRIVRNFWAPCSALCKEPYRLRERLLSLLTDPMDMPRFRRFSSLVGKLDPEEMGRSVSQSALAIARHLVKISAVQKALDHPSSPGPAGSTGQASPTALSQAQLEVLDKVEGAEERAKVRAAMKVAGTLSQSDITHLRTLTTPAPIVQAVVNGALAAAGLVDGLGAWATTKQGLRNLSALASGLLQGLSGPLSTERLRALVPHMSGDVVLSDTVAKSGGPEVEKLHTILVGIWTLNLALQPDAIEETRLALKSATRAKTAPSVPAPDAPGPGRSATEEGTEEGISTALLGISRQDVQELRALRFPPRGVAEVFEAVCLLLGQAPTMVVAKNQGPKGRRHSPDYWKAAQAMMRDANRFINRLQELADRVVNSGGVSAEGAARAIPQEALTRVGALIEKGHLDAEVIRTSSMAAAGMAIWATRVYEAAIAHASPTMGGLTAISEARVHNPTPAEPTTPNYMRPTRSSSIKHAGDFADTSPGPGSVSQLSRTSSVRSHSSAKLAASASGSLPRYMLATASSKKKIHVGSEDGSDYESQVHPAHFHGRLRDKALDSQMSVGRASRTSVDRDRESVGRGSGTPMRHYMLSTQSSLRRMSTTLTEDDAQSVGSIGSRRSGTSFMSGSRRYRSKAITGEQPNFMRATSSKQLKMVTPHLEARSISKKVHHIEFVSRNDVVEIRGLRSPDKAVRLVTTAVAILLGIEPVRTHDFYNRRMEEDYWAPTVRAMLNGDEFLERMRQCRALRPKLHPTRWRKLRDIAQSPFFDPEVVGACSRAAVGMTRWVLDVWERGVGKLEGPEDEAHTDSESEEAPPPKPSNRPTGVFGAVRRTVFRLADMLTPRGLGRARERAERVSSAHKSSLAKEERASSGHKSSLAKEQAVGGEEGVASGTGERDEGGGGLQAHPLSPGLTEATAGPPTPSVTAGPATPSVTVGSGLSPGEEGRREDLGSPSREEVSFRMDAASE